RAELDAICEAADELLAAADPATALRLWMDRFLTYMAAKAGLSKAIRLLDARHGPQAQSRSRQDEALRKLLPASADAGVTRPDINADDVLLALSGLAVASRERLDPGQPQRMLDLLYQGLRR